MPKRHNRRQRKKVKAGEFQELGFSVSADLRSPFDEQQRDALFNAFLEECIEANGMLFGGGINETLGGYIIAGRNRSSATDHQREIVKAWLDSRGEFSNAKVGVLSDAWHSNFD